MDGRSWAGGRWAWAWAATAALVSAWGCRGSNGALDVTTYEVKGRVVLADGKPLTRGRVVFIPDDETGHEAAGQLGADGGFSLTTARPDDGAAPGRYKVKIEPAPPANAKKVASPAFPLKYIDEDSSDLRVTVKPEANQLDPIRLK